MKTSKRFMASISAGVFLLSGCTPGTNDRGASETNQPVRVKVTEIRSGGQTGAASYIGTIGESQAVPLSFLTAGTVEKVLVNEGQPVGKGQLLAVLNDENSRNAWQIASSKEAQARDAFNRLEPVYKKGSLPEVKYVEIKTALEQASSMAAMAEKSLKDCKLCAPADGMIGKKMIEPGMSIIPGNPVFQLVRIEKVKVSFPVPENEISAIAKGQKAVIRVSAIGDRLFEAEVSEIGVLSNPLSHTYMVKAELGNPENLLKPGMVCSVQLSSPGLSNRIIIPLLAVQQSPGGEKFVYTANESTGKAEKKPVAAGPVAGNGIVILSGLKPGDLLITEGYQKISENSPVQILR